MSTVSVVLPTQNKASHLGLTLNSLFHQTLDHSKFEVIVVDDGSTDSTRDVLEKYRQRDWNLIVLHELPKGRSVARNKGIRVSSGQVLVFIDDDSLCEEHFLEQHLMQYSRDHLCRAVVGGRREATALNVLAHSQNSQVSNDKDEELHHNLSERQLADHILRGLASLDRESFNTSVATLHAKTDPLPKGTAGHLERIASHDFSCPWALFMNSNASASREAVLKVGLFDEEFIGWGGEDREMGYRLFKFGCEFSATTNAVVFHLPHARDNQSEYQSWWINFCRFGQKHPYPEIFLRWRLVWSSMTMTEYERKVRDIMAGTLPEREAKRLRTEFRAVSSLVERGLDPLNFLASS